VLLLLHGYPQSALLLANPNPPRWPRISRGVAADLAWLRRAEPPVTPATFTRGRTASHAGRFIRIAGFTLVAHDYGCFLGLGFVHPPEA